MNKITKLITYVGSAVLGIFLILMGSEGVYEHENLWFAVPTLITGLTCVIWVVVKARQLDVSWPFDRRGTYLFVFQLLVFGIIVVPLGYIGQDLYVRGDAKERGIRLNTFIFNEAQSGAEMPYKEALIKTKLMQARYMQSVGLVLLCLVPVVGILLILGVWPLLSISGDS